MTRQKPWFPPGDHIVIRTSSGRDLGYAGPDGKTLYFRGYPVGTADNWSRIQQELNKEVKT